MISELRKLSKKLMRSRTRQLSSRRNAIQEFDCDILESRCMLAGDVQAVLSGNGTLTLRGDNDSNAVEVFADVNGDLVVQGYDGTTVTFEGDTADSQTIGLGTGWTIDNDIVVLMRGGDDEVIVSNLFVSDQVRANLGSGNDYFEIYDSNVEGDIIVRGAGGDDIVYVDNVSVGDDLSLVLGGNNDSIYLSATSVEGDVIAASVEGASAFEATDVFVGGRLQVRGSGGSDDSFLLSGVLVNDRAYFVGGGGYDSVLASNVQIDGDMFASLGGDDDIVQLSNVSVGGRTRIIGSGGIDELFITGSSFGDSSLIVLGGDDDYASVVSTQFANDLRVVGGGGNDELSVSLSSFNEDVIAVMGGGDDSVFLGDVVNFGADVTYLGGGGTDSIGGVVPNLVSEPRYVSVEIDNLTGIIV